MKTYIIAAALAALISIPAAAIAQSSNAVIVGGHVVGQDPDSNIRGSIIRESGPGQSD